MTCSEWRLARRECSCLLGFITKTPPVVSIFLHRVPSNTLTPFHLCPTQYKFARAQKSQAPNGKMYVRGSPGMACLRGSSEGIMD